jgi:hypothetical protein
VVTLDAFARCWVQEDRLLREAHALLDPTRQPEMERLRGAWRERNLEVFHASMKSIAAHLAAMATDRELVPEKVDPAALVQSVKGWWARRTGASGDADPAVARAMKSLTERLEARLRANTDHLISLHGLAGRAQAQILARAENQFDVARPADVAGTGIVGGVVSGALGGLAADLSVGGISLGAGVIVGAILGALGAGGAARAYNLLQGQEDGSVKWSPDFLTARAQAAVLRYLAVAHFGRGRGNWTEGESPAHWRPLVDAALAARAEALRAAWAFATDDAAATTMAATIEREIAAATAEVLERLYPEAAQILR